LQEEHIAVPNSHTKPLARQYITTKEKPAVNTVAQKLCLPGSRCPFIGVSQCGTAIADCACLVLRAKPPWCAEPPTKARAKNEGSEIPSMKGCTMKSLIPWRRQNGGPLEPFRQEMDNLFDWFLASPFAEGHRAVQTKTPRVDVEETEMELLVDADLPGVDAKNVVIKALD
jgi:hypothetical protein